MKFSPITILALAGCAAAGAPSYCRPPGVDSKNGYNYYDVSEQCKKAGIAENCCVIFSNGGYADQQCGDAKLKEKNIEDLHHALAQHVSKDGQWETTEVGGWQVNYQLFTTALHHREFYVAWNDGINAFAGEYPWDPTGVYFNAAGDGFYDQVYAKWWCH